MFAVRRSMKYDNASCVIRGNFVSVNAIIIRNILWFIMQANNPVKGGKIFRKNLKQLR